jgi:hypothetical protein
MGFAVSLGSNPDHEIPEADITVSDADLPKEVMT